MPPKIRRLDPRLDTTIAGLRVAGMPERAIYETLRSALTTPPSYRDVRASFARAGLPTRHAATVARNSGEVREVVDAEGHRHREIVHTGFPTFPGERQVVMSRYREQTRANSRLAADEFSRKALQKATDRNFVLGYLMRSYNAKENRASYEALLASIQDSGIADDVTSIYESLRT
jgi:hypothetical protein